MLVSDWAGGTRAPARTWEFIPGKMSTGFASKDFLVRILTAETIPRRISKEEVMKGKGGTEEEDER